MCECEEVLNDLFGLIGVISNGSVVVTKVPALSAFYALCSLHLFELFYNTGRCSRRYCGNKGAQDGLVSDPTQYTAHILLKMFCVKWRFWSLQ